jgi:hypothetical protein
MEWSQKLTMPGGYLVILWHSITLPGKTGDPQLCFMYSLLFVRLAQLCHFMAVLEGKYENEYNWISPFQLFETLCTILTSHCQSNICLNSGVEIMPMSAYMWVDCKVIWQVCSYKVGGMQIIGAIYAHSVSSDSKHWILI